MDALAVNDWSGFSSPFCRRAAAIKVHSRQRGVNTLSTYMCSNVASSLSPHRCRHRQQRTTQRRSSPAVLRLSTAASACSTPSGSCLTAVPAHKSLPTPGRQRYLPPHRAPLHLHSSTRTEIKALLLHHLRLQSVCVLPIPALKAIIGKVGIWFKLHY